MQSGFSTRSVSTSGHSATSSTSSLPFPSSENSAFDASTPGYMQRVVTPVGQRPHRYSLASSRSNDIPQYQPVYEPAPPSHRSSYHAPSRQGPRYSMPLVSSGFIPVSSTFETASQPTHALVSYGSEPSGLAPPPTNPQFTPLGFTPAPPHTPVSMSYAPRPSVSPSPTSTTTSTSTGSFRSTSLPPQPQPSYVPQPGYNPPVSAPPSSHPPTLPLQMYPPPSQSAPPQVLPGPTQPLAGEMHEYISPTSLVQVSPVRVVSSHVPGSRPLPPQPQQATQRIPTSASISANQAYNQAIGALPLPYGQNPVPPHPSDPGLPPVQQNPLPVPPGPPGPLGPGFHTPPRPTNAVVPIPTNSSYRHVPSPSPQPSPSRQSPNPHIADGMAQSNGFLPPPSPVPPQRGQLRSVSGRPSLPLPLPPPPPPPPVMGSYQHQPFPQLPIPPSLVSSSSQSQQQYLPSSTSAVMQGGLPFYSGPPPRPPAQIADSLEPAAH
jgi:neural Wiskott-Aldrich syndrome protein